MKTQLLEDICESTTLTLVPSKVAPAAIAEPARVFAPAINAAPAMPRSAVGVWRQKPTAALVAQAALDAQPSPLELDSVFEEIAALEAQYVAPGLRSGAVAEPLEPQQEIATFLAETSHEPEVEAAVEPALERPIQEPIALPRELEIAADPRVEPAISAAGLQHQLVTTRAEPTLSAAPSPSAAALADPLFDYLPPSSPMHGSSPFSSPSSGFSEPKQRYMVWGACLLAGALLIQGDLWLSDKRPGTSAVAAKANSTKQVSSNGGADAHLVAANTAVLVPTSSPQSKPASPVVPTNRTQSVVPPLVLLDPAPASEEKTAPVAAPIATVVPPIPSKAESRAAQQRAEIPPGPTRRVARRQAAMAAESAALQAERESSRIVASATSKESGRDTNMAATLKACKDHGYQADQCVKRACSMTKYGFVCRGS